jgi:hypothetical protein
MLSSETLLNILDASGGNWQDHFAHKERMADSVTCMATVQDAVWVGTSQVITVPAPWGTCAVVHLSDQYLNVLLCH